MKKLDLLLCDDYWDKKLSIAYYSQKKSARAIIEEAIELKTNLVNELSKEKPNYLQELKQKEHRRLITDIYRKADQL